jgi:hypothetical protein
MKTQNTTLSSLRKIMLGLAVLATLIGAGSSLITPAPKTNAPAQVADGQETHGFKPAQNA